MSDTCPKCGSRAYVGFSAVECTNLNCSLYKSRLRSAAELVSECRETIENCELTGDQLEAFLFAFICEAAKDGDIEEMKRNHQRAQEQLSNTLIKGIRDHVNKRNP